MQPAPDTPPRVLRFVPVCLRHEHGYYAGPIGYVESEWLPGPVVLDVRKHATAKAAGLAVAEGLVTEV